MTGSPALFSVIVPRNAHHWMVIGDDIYDHRQALMHRTQAAHGLSECQIGALGSPGKSFRRDMIKRQPSPTHRIGGVEIPLKALLKKP